MDDLTFGQLIEISKTLSMPGNMYDSVLLALVCVNGYSRNRQP